MNSWQISQLKFAFGIGGFMSFYGIVGLIVYMLPASTASYNQKIVVIALILLTMPFTLLVGYVVARRSKKKEEKAAAAVTAAAAGTAPAADGTPSAVSTGDGEGPAAPAKFTAPAGTYTDLNSGLEEVVQFLKGSNLGEGGKDAIYSLPWYIVAGGPKTGKSSLVIGSELNFQTLPSQRPSELRAIRPTRSVDWRVASDGLFIDTAGRYQTEGADSDEWASLLEAIKRSRANRPLDGLLLIVNSKEILSSDERQLEQKAKILRSRLDEAMQRLKVRFPIYLIFTNADAIEGFSDSFSASKQENKTLVWGSTIPLDKSDNAQALFDSEFEILHDSVMKRRLIRLSAPFPPVRQLRIFNFPLHFGSARRKFSAFVNALFRPSPFSENPLLRGFYFTAVPQSRSRTSAPQTNGHSYFTERLFRDVILRDRDLVKTFQAQRQRRPIFGWFLTFLLAFVTFVLLVMCATSLYFNRQMLLEAKSRGGNVLTINKADAKQNVLQKDAKAVGEELNADENLRQLLVQMDDYERNGAPIYMRFGLYSGNSIYKHQLLPIYFNALEQRFKIPTKNRLEADLRKFASSQPVANPGQLSEKEEENLGKNFALLQAYLMLTGQYRDKADPTHLVNTLKEYWVSESKIPPDLRSVAEAQLEFWAKQVDREDADWGFPRIALDTKLVADVREKLKAFPLAFQYYKRKVTEISKQVDERYGKSSVEDILTRNGAENPGLLEGSYVVQGAYTKQGYALMETAIADAAENLNKDNWVMGDVAQQVVAQSADASRINDRYLRDYADQWRNFVKGVTVRQYKNKDDAASALSSFSSANSPIKILSIEIAKNTNLSAKTDEGGLWNWIMSWFSSKKQADTGGNTEPEKEFRPLFVFVGENANDPKAPVEAYRNELGKAYNDFNGISQNQLKEIAQQMAEDKDPLKIRAHENKINDLLKPFSETPSSQEVALMLQRPLGNLRQLLGADAKAQLAKMWAEQILPAAKEIEVGYPFQDGAAEADLTKVTAFLNPSDGKLSKFYDERLKRYFEESNGQLKLKDNAEVKFSDEFIAYLNNAMALRKALFGTNATPKFEYEFTLRPVQGSLVEIIIDGQKATSDATGSIKGTFPAGGTDTGVFINSGGSGSTTTGATSSNSSTSGKPPAGDDGSGTKKYPGSWGLFRFVDDGKPQKQPGGEYLLTYNVGGKTVTATIKPSGGDLFDKNIFRSIKAPQSFIK
jgi:type VI secretion system protein ImpL